MEDSPGAPVFIMSSTELHHFRYKKHLPVKNKIGGRRFFQKETWFLSMKFETFKLYLVKLKVLGISNYDVDNNHKCQTASDWVMDFYLSQEIMQVTIISHEIIID